MERLPTQSFAWRGFALLVVTLLAFVAVRGGMAVGTAWEAARAAYWLCAPVGLAGYAFGFRPISIIFWRVYAVIFTAESAVRMAVQASSGRHGILILLIAGTSIVFMCVALLRYAELVQGGNTEPEPPQPMPAALEKHGSLAGYAAAVIGSSIIGSIVLGIAVTMIFGSVRTIDLLSALTIAFIAVPVSATMIAICAFLLGLPFTWLVARLSIEGPLTYGLGGFALGSFLLLTGVPSNIDWIVKGSGSIYGCACGLLWWRFYRRHAVSLRIGS